MAVPPNRRSAKEAPTKAPTLEPPWLSFAAGALLVLAGLATYLNSFAGPFIFDDELWITKNPSIRQLWPIGSVLWPPSGAIYCGRPVLNLSLAVNYAWGGTGVGGYHAFNLAVHLVAGLALFGIVHRTLLLSRNEIWRAQAARLAFFAALLWLVHPLQTESVTYVIQRAEALMGMFYLLTLYG
ncbi:MAG TPA: hypothetical protein VFB27_06085, partial [Opitutaceae bacterium]|nr:hypothetical protein [Opitutaceae bacterium]